MDRYGKMLAGFSRTTGHTPYDSYALGQWVRFLDWYGGGSREVAPPVRWVNVAGKG